MLVINVESLETQFKLKKLANFNLTQMLQDIGGILEASTHERIGETKKDPEGQDWIEWSEAYAGSKHGPKGHEKHKGSLRESGAHSILNLSGALNDSIQWQVDGDEVTIGSPLIYAGVQQENRPFLGLSNEDNSNIETYVADFLTEELQ